MSKPLFYMTVTELAKLVNKSAPAISKSLDKNETFKDGRRTGVKREAVSRILTKYGVKKEEEPFRVYAVASLRGGAGKTSISTSLASYISMISGKKGCLHFDMDPQGSSSQVFNHELTTEDPVLLDIYKEPQKLKEIIRRVSDGIDIVPTSLDNALIDTVLNNPADQKTTMYQMFLEARNLGYSSCVIDNSPSLNASVVSTLAGISLINEMENCEGTLIIPVNSDRYSIKGKDLILGELEKVLGTFRINMPKIKIVFNKYSARENLSLETLTQLYSNEPNLMPTLIRVSSEFNKITNKGMTAFTSHRKNSIREDLESFCEQLLELKLTEKRQEVVSEI